MAVERRWWAFALAVLAIVAAGLFVTEHERRNASRPSDVGQAAASDTVSSGQPMLPTQHITVGSVPLTVEVASTVQEQESGLSGRAGLANGTGMLFVFPQPAEVGFWMKDMRFSLDIIFADASGTIVTIHPDLSPGTYPQAFYPSAPAMYVLEVPAGWASAHGVAVGQKIVVQ